MKKIYLYYMSYSYIVSMVKMESNQNYHFGLKIIVESGLENFILKSL